MTKLTEPTLAARWKGEHQVLDDLFGEFLMALEKGDVEATRLAIEEFDGLLRRHTEREEEQVFRPTTGEHLGPLEGETEEQRLFRELRLEHVQVREVSGMILRLLSEARDLEGARRLAPNLARRWDAHTSREERELPRFMSDLT
jgi:Hemerythrin HHE cation binding domain